MKNNRFNSPNCPPQFAAQFRPVSGLTSREHCKKVVFLYGVVKNVLNQSFALHKFLHCVRFCLATNKNPSFCKSSRTAYRYIIANRINGLPKYITHSVTLSLIYTRLPLRGQLWFFTKFPVSSIFADYEVDTCTA